MVKIEKPSLTALDDLHQNDPIADDIVLVAGVVSSARPVADVVVPAAVASLLFSVFVKQTKERKKQHLTLQCPLRFVAAAEALRGP